jgi:hypothetical protein
MAYDNTNTGALFHKDVEAGSKRPNVSGKITLGKELLKEMIDEIKAGKEATIFVAGWERTSKSGSPYISLTVSGPSESAKFSKKTEEKKASKDDFAF